MNTSAGEGYDIAGAALWLASDDSSFVTRQLIAVDGGAAAVVNPLGLDPGGVSVVVAPTPAT